MTTIAMDRRRGMVELKRRCRYSNKSRVSKPFQALTLAQNFKSDITFSQLPDFQLIHGLLLVDIRLEGRA
jgi:hypothetical protein